MTASRVLSGAGQVRPDKVQLVLDAAVELGYRRNENARSLRPGQRTGLVGVIISNAANPYYAELQLGIEEQLSPLGVRTLVGNTGDDPVRERQLIADFEGWNVDGLIVVPSGDPASFLTRSVPIVLASRRAPGVELDTVLIDDVEGTRAGTALLASEGHRKIAFLGLGMSVSTSERRLQGFRRALADAGIAVDDRLIRTGRAERSDPRQSARALLELDDPPTAAFTANNRNTIAMMHALHDRGAHATLRIAGFDPFETSDLMPVHVSIVDHDPRELGRRAAELLVRRLDGADDDPIIIELPTTLIP
jgi:LacI family transcriptional regulator